MKKFLISTRILLSFGIIAFLVGVVTQGTFAVISDVERGNGNTFAAGFIDLQVGSECRYKTLSSPATSTCDATSTFTQTNLGPLSRFFAFGNLEPGDFGANSIAIKSISTDAWGRMKFLNIKNYDNSCTEPEIQNEPSCVSQGTATAATGELQQNLLFNLWLDEGATPGFQCGGVRRCTTDSTEGDELKQSYEVSNSVLDGSLAHGAYTEAQTVKISDMLKLGTSSVSGGKYPDGHMDHNFTYFLGIAWELPLTTNNIVQTDSFLSDILFEVQQYNNNSDTFTP